MSKEREELIEVMARGIWHLAYGASLDEDENGRPIVPPTWDEFKAKHGGHDGWIERTRDIAQAALSAIEGAGYEVRRLGAPTMAEPPKPGDRVTIRTLVAHVDGDSFKPTSGWHSTGLIVSNDGPNMISAYSPKNGGGDE